MAAVCLLIPRRARGLPSGSHSRGGPNPASSTGRHGYRIPCVLVIDDEPHVADLAERYLRESGIDVITATNGNDALRLARKHADELDAIIVDYLMPRVTGAEIIDAILELTDVDTYLTSGYSRGEVDEPALRQQLTGFIPKPFSHEDFRKLFGESTTSTKNQEL
ncbi:MAG: response regulator [Gammaproteobacteria bacterium]|nr:response regulator [Gammaproteobacteria bacterium]